MRWRKVVVEYALIWEYNENAVVLNFDKKNMLKRVNLENFK